MYFENTGALLSTRECRDGGNDRAKSGPRGGRAAPARASGSLAAHAASVIYEITQLALVS